MKQLLTPPVRKILKALDNNACLVGGCVRDTLLGRPVNDIDIATPLSPDAVMARLKAAGISVIPTGLKHGTVTAVIKKTPYEITTLRQDTATDGRHATVTFTTTYAADATRRDFTVNALYLTPDGMILDAVNGRTDLAARRLRFIGDPVTRIREDYLRLLRFFRFLAQLPDFSPDGDSLTACAREVNGLSRVSNERKRDELFKILTAPQAVRALALMERRGVLPHLLPTYRPDIFNRFIRQWPTAPLLERLTVLTDGHIPTNLVLSRAQKKHLTLLCKQPDLTTEAQYVLNTVGPNVFRFYVERENARQTLSKNQLNRLKTLSYNPCPITGADLLKAGFQTGVRLGGLLEQAHRFWAAETNPQKKLVIQKLWSYNNTKGDII